MEKAALELDKAAMVLKLLGDKTRLTIIALLEKNDCCVCEFVEIFKMSQPAISQHLRKLKDAGLVEETRKGQWMFYSINRKSVFYPFLKEILAHLPNQQDKLKKLDEAGLRITCK
ncbi:ArsR/SmtB family transcription factor [Bacillus taeanensis]|uniref:ArsR family transcriptional regulator n=1 Tax=Bacillus taeanensis TaxID=273032 RepID=A0A366XMZ1_9BACI|nr:metalloregulator ArsR/SmtB family transcription factor [Bacillus taeanensis]RBW67492.1 ArsR family transcriptional regulator [Bacillus taeanensis]